MAKLFADWKRPLQAGLAAALLTALGTAFLPNYYLSQARVLPVEGRSSGLGGSGMSGLAATAAAFGVAVPGGEGNDANFVDILKSRWMAEQLLGTTFDFQARSFRFGKLQSRHETLGQYLAARNPDEAVRKIGNLLVSTRDSKTRVITITAETKVPELSQAVLQKAASLLESFVQRKGRTHGGAKALFSEARLREAREDLLKAEDALRDYATGNRNYATSTDPSVRIRGLRLEVELRIQQQRVATLMASHEQALMEEKNDIPIVNMLDYPNLPYEKSGPHRSILCLGAFLAATLAVWAWSRRSMIQGLMVEPGAESGGLPLMGTVEK